MLVLATSSDKSCLSQLGLFDIFDSTLHVPIIRDLSSVMNCLREQGSFEESEMERIERTLQTVSSNIAISVKKLLMLIELSRQDERNAVERFVGLLEEHILSNN